MLSPHPNVKGPLPKHTPLLANALRDLGCQVTLLPWGRHSDCETNINKVVQRVRDIFQVRHSLQRNTFDVLVVKTSHDWRALLRDLPLLVATVSCRPATVLQFHGSQPEKLLQKGNLLFKVLTHHLLRRCDAVMVLSTEEQRAWEQFYPQGRFFVVSNPFASMRTDASEVDLSSWNLPSGTPLLLFVGRLIREKGIFDLLEALRILRDRGASYHLLVAGDGPLAEQVKARVRDLRLANAVTLAGYLGQQELAAVYHMADIFVLPTYWAEGFPTVIAEAMSFGLPIVTTAIRGTADHLQEGVNALFVPPQDADSLANAIERLLSDAALREAMSKANREKVKDFAPEVVAQHYMEVLKKTLHG